MNFETAFKELTGNPPFPWQIDLYSRYFSQGTFPESCNLPTGLGKTSVIAIWLIALANDPTKVPRRLVYVVNRRTVVDQTTTEVERYRGKLLQAQLDALLRELCAIELKNDEPPLALSTLRGQFADNREWSADPARPAVICGTVDMIGSRLLFSGYGVGFKGKPLHAGFLGQDVLLVHDEAHLEPAFQTLIEAICDEQGKYERTKNLPWPKLRIMALTATSRGGAPPFELTDDEMAIPSKLPKDPSEPIHYVWQRMKSRKALKIHSAKRDSVAKKIGDLARQRWMPSGKAILIFVRTLDDVETVHDELTKQLKDGPVELRDGAPPDSIRRLTGTMRGLERDELAESDPVFARFLPKPNVAATAGTVYLVCTSAGEVGVDISADHMVCDLTTLDSMAQRFGRVNRRGEGEAEIDVVCESDPNPKPPSPDFEAARWQTKTALQRLNKCDWIKDRLDGSPAAIGLLMRSLTESERRGAFAPPPIILSTTDILFDAWALTTIQGKLPGRPLVEPYLHGICDYDPPQTTIAWRREVELLTPNILERNKLEAEDILDLFPLKPHEELAGPTYGKNKVFEQLEKIATRDLEREPDQRLSAWVIDQEGSIQIFPLAKLVEKDKQNKPLVALGGCTVLLPPLAGGLSGGHLKGAEPFTEATAYDVSDHWYADKHKTVRRRWRGTREDAAFATETKQMRLVRSILIPGADDETEGWNWVWFTRPHSADDDGSKSANKPLALRAHTTDVARLATKFADTLLRDEPELQQALILAARFHDLGKMRAVWQRSIGNQLPRNPKPEDWLAKSGGEMKPRENSDYRHEFGSLLDLQLQSQFSSLNDNPELQDLILHLVAAHHGYGRPHFPEERAFDPEPPKGMSVQEIAAKVPQNFARLQRKYGRWGLAYLESLLRAADWAASANPSPEGIVGGEE